MIIAATTLCVVMTAGAQSPDFSGVEQFWQLAVTLQQGHEPNESDWDALFATPGYAALEKRERRRAALETGIRLALNPALVNERDRVLGGDSWTARVIRHVQQLPARKEELVRLRDSLVNDDFLTKAIALAETLLPEGAHERWGAPNVAFIFFLPDGRGYPDIIVSDLANVASPSDLVPFFAHELTHFYYAQLARARGLDPRTPLIKQSSRCWQSCSRSHLATSTTKGLSSTFQKQSGIEFRMIRLGMTT